MMFAANAASALNDANHEAWNSFHLLDDVVDCMTMYTISSLPGKNLTTKFYDLFEIIDEDSMLPLSSSCTGPRSHAKVRRYPRGVRRSSPFYWHCPVLANVEYKAAARIARPAKAFAVTASTTGTLLPPIAEGVVHFMEGFVSGTCWVPNELLDRAARGSMKAMIAQKAEWNRYEKEFGLQDMDWEPTPDGTDEKVTLCTVRVGHDHDKEDEYHGNDDANSWCNTKDDEEEENVEMSFPAIIPIVLDVPAVEANDIRPNGNDNDVIVLLSRQEEPAKEPTRPRRSARLAAKVHPLSDTSPSLLGSVMVHGLRRSARLMIKSVVG